jgi:hypothetical protein
MFHHRRKARFYLTFLISFDHAVLPASPAKTSERLFRCLGDRPPHFQALRRLICENRLPNMGNGNTQRHPEKILKRHDQPLRIFGLLLCNSYRYDAFKRRCFESRGFFCGARNTILEDKRVSAFRNFLMSASAEQFSFFVFDTVQSEGTNKLKSRM